MNPVTHKYISTDILIFTPNLKVVLSLKQKLDVYVLRTVLVSEVHRNNRAVFAKKKKRNTNDFDEQNSML